MRPSLLLLMMLQSCVTTAEWDAVRKQNDDLKDRFERNQREGWSKEERESFRARLDRNSKRIEEVRPAEWKEVADYTLYVVGALFLGDKFPALAAVVGRRRRRKQPITPTY